MDEKIADRMRRLCSLREYCSNDIQKKLTGLLDGDHAQVQEILDMLVRERYVDDFRYACAFARDKSSIAGWGAAKIRYALASRKIPSSVIAQAIGQIETSRAQARLFRFMETKYRSLKDDPQCRIKMIRYALGRGYDYETVTGILETLTESK